MQLTHPQRFQFMAAVLADRKFTSTQKNVLIRLALHFNIENQRCYPGVKTIATGSGVSERAVQTTLAAARARGAIDVDIGGGREKTSNYRLLLGWMDTAETPHDGAPFVKTPRGETLFDGALNGAALGEKGAREGRKPRTAVHPNKKNIEINTEKNIERAFEEWWELYPKHVAKGAARKAYKRARVKGASAEELKLGAMRYSASVTGHDPNFIKHPATWLNGECWLDEPAKQSAPTRPATASADNGWAGLKRKFG
jgi:hypothetical protein